MNSLRVPSGVGWTSLLTAYARAQESRRTDRLFEDAWAQAFIAATAGVQSGVSERLPRLGPARDDGSSALWTIFCAYFAGRTPFYDEQLRAGLENGARQAVLLAAGLDTRALRLDLPSGTKVFEIDNPAVLEFKQAVLDRMGAQTTGHVPIAADLRGDWATALTAAGFLPSEPTVWIAEGLLMYLTAAECDQLLDAITKLSGPGSRFLTDYFTRNPRMDDDEIADSDDRWTAEMITGMFRSGPSSSPYIWLPSHGWRSHTSDITAELRRHQRPIPDVFDLDRPDPVGVWLVAGTR